ncbi:succinic semialdehyde dehydrogenase [Cryobacterium sp. BB736]|uniref:succinic semialdehyde dehydrogenase n=1 Tax=Cryobacterium sp. BB736 TaxID=2746963 RepID=UPI001875FAEF|nr:succinic semialdehyde dehydrogenase [Cryobacterium sp. BB736]
MSALPVTRAATEGHRGLTATSGETAAVNQPFTGELLHELPLSSLDDVADAAARARLAQLSWSHAGFEHRRKVLLRAHDLLLERREELLDILQAETGKARLHAFEDLGMGVTATRYYAIIARDTLRTRARRGLVPLAYRTRVGYRAKGLIGVITPWNYPIALALMDVVPALASGNGVLQKADNQGALTTLAVRQAFIDAGLPSDLWGVVAGPGTEIGGAVIDAADYVAFTGSTATGIRVGTHAAAALKGASLELGGKNPMIVLDDVNVTSAAKDAVNACFSSMGQLCVSIERIYVQRPIAAEFIAEFVARTESLTLGAAYDNSVDLGSLTLPSQLEHVEAHVQDAVAKGATVLTGGKRRPELGPLFYEPTVLTGVTEQMECFAAETFGPVVAISVVDSEEEAIVAANDSEFGLNASIFSGSRARARRLADGLQAGTININEGFRATFSSVDAPMGGVKRSGLGRRNGPEGLLRYVDARTVSEATGLFTLPRTGAEAARLGGLTLAALKALKFLRAR